MARKRMSRILTFTVTNTAAQFLGPSTQRKILRFGSSSTGTVWWNLENTVVVGGGLVGTASADEISEERHGDIVHQAWFAISSAASATANVMETIEE